MKLSRGALLGRVGTGAAAVALAVTAFSAAHGGTAPRGDATLDASQQAVTATNGTNKVTFSDGHALTLGVTATDGAWSYNGSRMAFVDGTGAIRTVRFDNPTDLGLYVPADGSTRSDLSWDNVQMLTWSARVTDPTTHVERDVIQYANNGGPVETMPLPADTNWTHISGDIDYLVQGEKDGQDSIYRFGWLPGQKDPIVAELLVADATNPAWIDSRETYVYTKDDAGGHEQVWIGDRGNAVGYPVEVTSDPIDHTNLRADGPDQAVAFNEGNDIYTSQSLGSLGATPPAKVPGLSGIAAFQHPIPATVLREAGSNRYLTALAISQATWAPPGGDEVRMTASSVVLTRGDMFADALGGSALATAKQGPLLLTPPQALDPNAAKEITRILNPGSTVYILGGTGAISASVEKQVQALGMKTSRIAGADRYDTAVRIARQITATPKLVLVATGRNFPDALSAGAVAGSADDPSIVDADRAVVVLSSDGTLPATAVTYLNGLEGGAVKPTFVGVGGFGAQALKSAGLPGGFSLVGQDRYQTAVMVAEQFFPGARLYGLATGQNWPDALAGSAMLGTFGAPLLLTPPTMVNPTVLSYLDLNSGSFAGESFVFGQTDVVSDAVSRAYATASGAGAPQLSGTSKPLTSKNQGGHSQLLRPRLDAASLRSSKYVKPLS
jgi:ell wall binding domain 2 (CWB2)